jgi:signal transduction histidine kinase
VADHEATERILTTPTRDEPDTAAQRGSFLGFVAHEMRNPLSTALWSAELLARLSMEERGGARGEKLSGMCLRALQRLRSLVEDHFLAERLDVGGIPFRMEAVSLREAVSSVVAKAGGVNVTSDVHEDLAVWVDRMLLERAIDGLIAAAAQGKSPVSVAARRAGQVALLRVRGAPPAADALEPPQKGTASDATGRALALHMVVRIGRALGGSLSATEEDYILALPLESSGSSLGT